METDILTTLRGTAMWKPSFAVVVIIVALAALSLPCAALADGGYMEPTATTESDVAIEMVDQRALLWVGAAEN
jgi:hypothetical protein